VTLRNVLERALQSKTTPTHLVTAVKLPSGAVEIAVNTSDIKSKLEYILRAYDEEMQLRTNTAIVMVNAMVVS
jgi:hypothetical protein